MEMLFIGLVIIIIYNDKNTHIFDIFVYFFIFFAIVQIMILREEAQAHQQ